MSAPAKKIFSYQPIGAARNLFLCKEPEVLLSGPAGTGKSRACLEKLHLCAMKYKGMRGLIVRKTRESVSESALVTFEDKVLTPNDPMKEGLQRRMRQIYSYLNGSEIVVGGMDKPSKIMSTEFDMAYVQEATELNEDDWESITTRLRNNVIPYQQLIADCNPSSHLHWLKRRAERGATSMFESRHTDNPVLWDLKANQWTANGYAYISKLDALTGVRKKRLRDGIWAAAEGMVYEDVWEPAIHLVNRFDIPKDWPRYLSVDFGFTNPFVCSWFAEDPDGRLYRYREIYQTQTLVEDHARAIKPFLEQEPSPSAVICDHDAEGRETLKKHLGIETTAAIKGVQEGIQAVAARLRKAGDGKPRLFYMRDSLISRDPRLDEARKPCSTEEEIEGYVWAKAQDGKPLKEEPVKENDHGCDATRYIVAYRDCQQEGWNEWA